MRQRVGGTEQVEAAGIRLRQSGLVTLDERDNDPVVLLRHIAAALAHTGALVGSDRSFSAMLRHYDAIRVDDFGDWVEHLEVFGREKPPRGRKSGSSPTGSARA